MSLYAGFFWSRFGPIVPRPFAALSTWQVTQLATKMALPFLALPGFVAANAGIAIATPSAAMATPEGHATDDSRMEHSVPPVQKDRDFASTIRMAQRFDNEDFRDSTMRISQRDTAWDWARAAGRSGLTRRVLALAAVSAALLAGCGGEPGPTRG